MNNILGYVFIQNGAAINTNSIYPPEKALAYIVEQAKHYAHKETLESRKGS